MKPRAGFQPKKELGQHFLVDTKITEKIIAQARFRESDQVLEIGAGRGALTLPLARSVGHVLAVEKDRYLIDSLEEKLSASGITNVTPVNNDILSLDFRRITPLSSKKIQVIGNLPYSISSPILDKLMENRDMVSRAVLMFQLEVASRLTASPGGRTYGAMTLLVRYHANPTPLLEVSKQAFYPRPKVDSMVIELDFERPYPRQEIGAYDFRRVVRGAFAHRRKTLLNSLKGSFPRWTKEMLSKAMKDCEVDPKRRAETLTMDEFICLASALTIDKKESN